MKYVSCRNGCGTSITIEDLCSACKEKHPHQPTYKVITGYPTFPPRMETVTLPSTYEEKGMAKYQLAETTHTWKFTEPPSIKELCDLLKNAFPGDGCTLGFLELSENGLTLTVNVTCATKEGKEKFTC